MDTSHQNTYNDKDHQAILPQITKEISEASFNYRKSGNSQYFLRKSFKYGESIDLLDRQKKIGGPRKLNLQKQESSLTDDKIDDADEQVLSTLQHTDRINQPDNQQQNHRDNSFEEKSSTGSLSLNHSVNEIRQEMPDVKVGGGSGGEGQVSNFTQIMMSRWESHIAKIPRVDMNDIMTHNLNMNGGETCTNSSPNQPHPEYSQLSYLRMRATEEVFAIYNYLDAKENPAFREFLKQDDGRDPASLMALQTLRTKGIQKIISLHSQKAYKMETLFLACNIFDRYLCVIGHWNYPKDGDMALACVSLLLAAKLEEDVCPSFPNMVLLLTPLERRGLTKQKMEDLELDIITRFGYEFNYQGPIESMQRYLRLISQNKDQNIAETCHRILKFQLKFAVFLKYRPSEMAACAVIIASNYHEKCREVAAEGEASGLALALDDCTIWFDKEIVDASGYTSEHLQEPLGLLLEHLRTKSKILTVA